MREYAADRAAAAGELAGLRVAHRDCMLALLERSLEVAFSATDTAIARELFIALPTVARHVANIFAKLGFSSRAQVAAWVAERMPDCQQS